MMMVIIFMTRRLHIIIDQEISEPKIQWDKGTKRQLSGSKIMHRSNIRLKGIFLLIHYLRSIVM